MQSSFIGWDFSFTYSLKAIFITLTVILVWNNLKQLWKDSIDLKTTREAYYYLKRNKEIFFTLLKRGQQHSADTINSQHTISFGAEQAAVKITAITSPLCGFCKDPFQEYDKLLQLYPDDIQVTFVFNIPDDIENDATQIVLSILRIHQQDPDKAFQAMRNWFQNRDLEDWFSNYPKTEEDSTSNMEVVRSHHQWCADNEMYYTPVTVVNDHLFPKSAYEISDLSIFIDDFKNHKDQRQLVEL